MPTMASARGQEAAPPRRPTQHQRAEQRARPRPAAGRDPASTACARSWPSRRPAQRSPVLTQRIRSGPPHRARRRSRSRRRRRPPRRRPARTAPPSPAPPATVAPRAHRPPAPSVLITSMAAPCVTSMATLTRPHSSANGDEQAEEAAVVEDAQGVVEAEGHAEQHVADRHAEDQRRHEAADEQRPVPDARASADLRPCCGT